MKVIGKSRYGKPQKFYKISGKIYVKGIKSNSRLVKLDKDKIVNSIKDYIKPLYNA